MTYWYTILCKSEIVLRLVDEECCQLEPVSIAKTGESSTLILREYNAYSLIFENMTLTEYNYFKEDQTFLL